MLVPCQTTTHLCVSCTSVQRLSSSLVGSALMGICTLQMWCDFGVSPTAWVASACLSMQEHLVALLALLLIGGLWQSIKRHD